MWRCWWRSAWAAMATGRSWAWRKAPRKTESWRSFLRHLKSRGLKGVQLVVSDKCLGLVEALAEFYRCLRPGGVAVINVPAYRWLWSYHDEMVHSKHRFSRREITGLAERAGFRVESSTYWNTLPFPLVVTRRKVIRVRPKAGDVRMYPAPLEAIFNAMMSIERRWLRSVGRLPFGSSVLMMARRPE